MKPTLEFRWWAPNVSSAQSMQFQLQQKFIKADETGVEIEWRAVPFIIESPKS